MTDVLALDDLLRRALLAYNPRAMHAGGEAGKHTAAFLTEVAADALKAMNVDEKAEQHEVLAQAYRCLSLAAENPLRQSCREQEELLGIACHDLAHAVLGRDPQEHAGKENAQALLAEGWTASLLAWSQLFPARLDTASPPCACGALGTRPELVPAVELTL